MFSTEVAKGQRFKFGENWKQFLAALNDERIALAEQSLCNMLEMDLTGMRFLDVGSGSGLFSLAARRLGAIVHSFDYDPQSVACTEELRHRYFPNDEGWAIEQGSALDPQYLARLGEWDIVYSWGVLHHTGEMWRALANVAPLVKPRGKLFIAIYNTQRFMTPIWTRVKRIYNRLPKGTRWIVVGPALVLIWGPAIGYDIVRGRPFETWRNYGRYSSRGMSAWRDLLDWVGGYPFETAKPEEIVRFYKRLGFTLENMSTRGGSMGCNEFVFTRHG